jgi:hypothetical protein
MVARIFPVWSGERAAAVDVDLLRHQVPFKYLYTSLISLARSLAHSLACSILRYRDWSCFRSWRRWSKKTKKRGGKRYTLLKRHEDGAERACTSPLALVLAWPCLYNLPPPLPPPTFSPKS